VALWEIAASARAGAWEPSGTDWVAASDDLRTRWQPGDLIVFAPRWLDPVGRMHFGDLIPIEMAGRMDADPYAVIWEISARGARAPVTRDLTPESTRRFGRVTVRRFFRERVEVVTDFVTEAQARKGKPGGAAQIQPTVSLEEVGFEPHRCIRVVPRPNQTATVTFAPAKLGSRIVGYVGLADVFTRRDVRDPARLELVVGENVVSSTEVGVDDGWVRFEANTEPGLATVEFRATAIGPNARDRRVCFAAEARN